MSIMVGLTFLILFCIKIATGHYEELQSLNSSPSTENSGIPEWPVPSYYKAPTPQVQRRKPCSHRRNYAHTGGQWAPLFSSLVTKPVDNILEPQALKNVNVDNTADESKASENLTKDESSTVTTPELEDKSNSDKHNRRSNAEESPNPNDDQLLSENFDCDIDLDTKDYYDSQYGREQLSDVALTDGTDGIEHKVIEMLRDCMNMKQKLNADKLNQKEVIPIAGSRRSMGNFDTDIDDLNSVDDDKQGTTDTPVSSSTTALTNTDNNVSGVPDKVIKTAFTQRPGRLFMELQNPVKTTGIADESFTRRMSGDNSRVCYACSTVTNPSCWEPSNKTTIKYCRNNQNCITKSFGVKNTQTILRDCATSCDATSVPGIEPKYTSCSVCYTDYCNSAATSHYNLAIIFLLTSIKCAF